MRQLPSEYASGVAPIRQALDTGMSSGAIPGTNILQIFQ
ncbi:hypothetical protein EDC90_100691 [Martelella mediterranea]|uniref:Uncharacterized protein n=1 Tax=Martelella mediterranea TaxID=293089 RepID=A0A4R3NVU0_9HYPH|nr:hypothetical protein EDC90_100691 [Martelella mediterranea]